MSGLLKIKEVNFEAKTVETEEEVTLRILTVDGKVKLGPKASLLTPDGEEYVLFQDVFGEDEDSNAFNLDDFGHDNYIRPGKFIQSKDGKDGESLFSVEIKYDSTNRPGGTTFKNRRWVITNRPQAVRLGQMLPEQKSVSIPGECYSSRTFQEIWVREDLLGEEGFVAVYEFFYTWWGGAKEGTRFHKYLAGRKVSSADFNFGAAYEKWAEDQEEGALNYIESVVQGKNNNLRRTFKFACGRQHDKAPHDQRRRAWRSVLRQLSITSKRQDAIVGSVRTAPVKAALALGWKPSVPQPEFWEGLPSGAVELK